MRKQAEEMARKFREDSFSLEDFRNQLRQIKKLGSLEQILSMLPGMGMLKDLKKMQVDEKEFVRMEAIINSMTKEERRNVGDHQRQSPAAYRQWQRDRGSGRESPAEEL